ncbi:MAG: Eco57I restriction-modification methylase domain-containing protein [Phycisphaerales bacterium]|nr:Eco57I restriction-modification methylase domain-containing protein [Phycisphaerales bacterium]
MSTTEPTVIPGAVTAVIDRFRRNRDEYHSPAYNETQARRELIDPFFKALGWDVDNSSGLAEAYKDVIHEDAIRIGGSTKAPDYCFRIGGTRKFFVEAKKPGVDIKHDPEPAYQLRRYAWTSKLPLSILTDFEEFAVYDCRIKPAAGDNASVARVFYCTCDEYAAKWPEIAGLFSKDAVLKGDFDRYAESARKKRGTAEVDKAFLAEIEGWRDVLARNIALRNPHLTQRELNFAVQRTIDRIIFLRICEDRAIEPHGQLLSLVNGEKVYERLGAIFRRADEKYNSGIFHFEREKDRAEAPDTLTPTLAVDDKVLRDILKSLYYPDCPYEFSVLPADILGHVYEQFLGKVIRLTPGHRAVVEEKPEVRKAGGVYYTPTYIVDYIVRNTVGRLLGDEEDPPQSPDRAGSGVQDPDHPGAARPAPDREGGTDPTPDRQAPPVQDPNPGGGASPGPARGLTPTEAAKLRILDPACGSGSFLIGAYQYLLDWHLRWYTANDPNKWCRAKRPPLRQTTGPDGPSYRLTVAERKRILLQNIYGVDIDPQAVEVTKLSLLLKVLEGESGEVLTSQWRLLHERALPDLGRNIKCGNSLIGPDFYHNQQMLLLDEDERLRVNVFDWEAEFPEIMKAGGFDAVIGNPPYVRMEGIAPIKNYLRTHYYCHEERADLYSYFIERALALLRPTGTLSVIVSNKFIRAKYGKPLRELLSRRACVRVLADLAGANVFEGATVRTLVLVVQRRPRSSPTPTIYVPVPDQQSMSALKTGAQSLHRYARDSALLLPHDALANERWILASDAHAAILRKLNGAGIPLSQYTSWKPLFGVKTGMNEAFIINSAQRRALVRQDRKSTRVLRPILFGKDIRRYVVIPADRYVIYLHPDCDIADFPSIRAHLAPHRKALENRAGVMKWYQLQQPATALLSLVTKPKVVYPIIAGECRFALDSGGYLINDKAFMLPTSDLCLVALLNSRVANFFFAHVCAALEGAAQRYLEFRAQYVNRFPVPRILGAASDRLMKLGTHMSSLRREWCVRSEGHNRTALQRQIAAVDRQIDQLVYELYGLTEDEIRIVEEATAQ